MTHEVVSAETLKPGNLKYLFFAQPNALWQGDFVDEQHYVIMNECKRKLEEILVAGGMTVFADGSVTIDGFGSGSLEIPKKDPVIVAEFIKQLKGVDPQKVLAVKP